MKQLPIWCASAPYDSFGTLQKTTCRTSLCNPMTLHLRSSIVFLTAWLVLKPMIQTNSNMHAFLPTTTPSKIIHTPCFADVSRLKQFFVGTFLRTLPQLNVCERCLAGHRGDHKHYIRLDGVHVKSILSIIKVSPLYIDHGNEKVRISIFAHIVNVPQVLKTFCFLHILHPQPWN